MTEKHDFRQTVNARLSGLTMTPLQQQKLLARIREEEQPVKKKLSVSLVFALVLAILAATACAAAVRYGILDYNRHMAENPAYVEHILTIDETCESNAFTLTVNDAVFDGTALSLTMNVQPKEGAEPVFVHPRVSAVCNGQELDVDVEGGTGADFFAGFWVPGKDASAANDGRIGADFVILSDRATGAYDPTSQPVTWTVAFDVLTPLWPVEQDHTILHGDDTDVPFDEYMNRFREAYANQRILLSDMGEIAEFASILPVPEGMTDSDWGRTRHVDRLLTCGAFRHDETLSITLSTHETQLVRLSGDAVYRFGDYEVVFTDLTASFSRADYRLYVRKIGGETTAAQDYADGRGYWKFAVISEGVPVQYSASSAGLNDEETELICTGTLTLGAPVSELTFIPIWNAGWNAGDDNEPGGVTAHDIMYNGIAPTDEQMTHAFTVQLK